MNDQRDVAAWQLDQDSATAYEQYLVVRFFRRWAERLVALSRVSPDDRVLDAGCGTGIVARTTAAQVAPTGKVVGLDLNKGMLAEARRHDAAGQVTWVPGSVLEMPFDDGEFDVVLSQQVLQFVPERTRALAEMHRVLAPGGRLALALMRSLEFNRSYTVLATALDRHAGPAVGDMMRSPFAGPDSDTIRRELGDAGFHDVTIGHDILDVRFPDPGEFLRQEAASSPLAGPVSELDAGTVEALIADLDTALAPFADDHGVTFPMETHLVTARRQEIG